MFLVRVKVVNFFGGSRNCNLTDVKVVNMFWPQFELLNFSGLGWSHKIVLAYVRVTIFFSCKLESQHFFGQNQSQIILWPKSESQIFFSRSSSHKFVLAGVLLTIFFYQILSHKFVLVGVGVQNCFWPESESQFFFAGVGVIIFFAHFIHKIVHYMIKLCILIVG